MVTIGVEQSLSDRNFYKHRCLENINKLYKSACKCDDQKQYKAIIESEIVSISEGITKNSPMEVVMKGITKNLR